MSVVVDFSFAHAKVTPNALRKIPGCVGGIGYAGCYDRSKCITTAEMQALLAAGFQVGLVVENGAEDALQGAAVGTAQGRAILADAKDLGYDWQNSVLFGGADFNETNAGQYAATLAYMEAFAAVVPVPGYYGDSDSIDYLHARHSDWIFWQSDSRSFSPLNPTPNAALWQQFNDPRAGALSSAVDINNLLKPLPLMGADMALTDAQAQQLAAAAKFATAACARAQALQAVVATQSTALADAVTRIADLQSNLAALQAQVAAQPTVQPTDVPVTISGTGTAHIGSTS